MKKGEKMKEYIVGIDIGGTNIKIGLLKNNREIINYFSFQTESERGVEYILKNISLKISEIIGSAKANGNVEGIGVGIPGIVDIKKGIVKFAPNLRWHNLNFSDRLAELTNLPVKIDNDANVIAIGEALHGAAKEYKHIVVITLGTGIGAGIIINGKLYTGANGMAGELGHVKIETENGKYCVCGQFGCLNAYVSAIALVNETKTRLHEDTKTILWDIIDNNRAKLEAKHIFDACKEGDKFSLSILDNYVKYLCAGLSIVINFFNPEIIVIGGGMIGAKDILFDNIKDRLKQYAFEDALKKLKIIPSELGDFAGILGASALIYEGRERHV